MLAAPARADAQPPEDTTEPAVVMVEDDRPGRSWVGFEYLLWWTKDDSVPMPLITGGNPADARPGALGIPGTSILFGELDYRNQSGGRLSLGRWLDAEQSIGFESIGFVLETHTIHGEANAGDSGAPLIARPFFNVMTGKLDAQVITAPGAALGGIDVFADSRLWGGEGNFIGNLARSSAWSADLLGGFRYLGLKDELRFSQSSTLLAPGFMGFNGAPALPPDIISIRDLFQLHNQFYGGQLGLRGGWTRGRWSLDSAVKAGLGTTRQELRITGHTLDTNSAGETRLALGGLFSQPSNISFATRNEFTFISEIDVGVGCRLTRRLSAHLGYTFLYWGDVARPGQQLNIFIDPRQVPSNLAFGTSAMPAQPVRLFESTDYWAQGLSAGLLLKF